MKINPVNISETFINKDNQTKEEVVAFKFANNKIILERNECCC